MRKEIRNFNENVRTSSRIRLSKDKQKENSTKNRFANNRIYRWSLLIQEYSFTIKHRPGVENITADALTRNRHINTDFADTFTVALNTLTHEHDLYSYTQVHESQAHLHELRHKIVTQPHRGLSIKNNFIIKNIGEEKFVIDTDLTTHY